MSATSGEISSYLLGAMHDATLNRSHGTVRFAQRGQEWLHVLSRCLDALGYRSWSYEEGKRGVFVLETSWSPPPLSSIARSPAAYARGYFDADGGVPHSVTARFYIQFVQKDLADLVHLRSVLVNLGIDCGRVHNPSERVDPDYWRFFVRASSRRRFVELVSSWHPLRRHRLNLRTSQTTQSGRLNAH